MIFKDNYTTTNLLFAQPVTFTIYIDEQHMLIPIGTFQMKMPTYYMSTFDNNFKILAGLLNSPFMDIQKQFEPIAQFDSIYGMFLSFGMGIDKYSSFYFTTIKQAFALLGMDLEVNRGAMLINSVPIDEQVLVRITRIILMALALKKPSDFIDDPQLQAYQDKINRIKSKNQSKTVSSNFEHSFMILTYEFNYKPDEILNMTPYLINTLISYTGKSIRYKTTLIAAGNGNTKKVKFITDKGK